MVPASSPIAVAIVVRPTGTFEFVDYGQQDTVVDFIESVSVDVERFKRVACDREVYAAGAANHREVAHTTQQRVGYTRCATAAQCDFKRGFIVDSDFKKSGRAFHNPFENIVVIIFQMTVYAESGT